MENWCDPPYLNDSTAEETPLSDIVGGLPVLSWSVEEVAELEEVNHLFGPSDRPSC